MLMVRLVLRDATHDTPRGSGVRQSLFWGAASASWKHS